MYQKVSLPIWNLRPIAPFQRLNPVECPSKSSKIANSSCIFVGPHWIGQFCCGQWIDKMSIKRRAVQIFRTETQPRRSKHASWVELIKAMSSIITSSRHGDVMSSNKNSNFSNTFVCTLYTLIELHLFFFIHMLLPVFFKLLCNTYRYKIHRTFRFSTLYVSVWYTSCHSRRKSIFSRFLLN
jgi:hypothetical protein